MKKLLIIIGVTIGLNTSIVAGPIHEAAKTGDIDEIKSLIDIGVSVEHKSSDWGGTALFYAVTWSQFEAADYLISIEANVNAAINNGITPIFSALGSDKMKFLNLLISNGADVNHQNNEGETPIFHSGNTQIMNVLIASGADINHQDNLGRTMLLSQRLNSFMRLQLIENGADIDLKDIQGKTALHHAAGLGSPEEVQSLLTHKADVNSVDTYGKTPLNYISMYDDDFHSGHAQALQLLKEAGAKTGLQLLEEKVDQLSTGPTNPTDEWPRKMWEIDLGFQIHSASLPVLAPDGSMLLSTHTRVSNNAGNLKSIWISKDGSFYFELETFVNSSRVMYIDNSRLVYDQIFEGVRNTTTLLMRTENEVIIRTFIKDSNLTGYGEGHDHRPAPNDATVKVSWEGTKITAWDFTPPSNTVPNPDGANGGGNETANSRLIIKTAGPDIALATDGKLGGAAELQKSNDLRSWRKLGDVPAEASEVLLTPRESGNEFYRLKKK